MLSYRQWKMLNESVMPGMNLGVVAPTNLGAIGSQLGEAKFSKKSKKKMHLGDETGDGEMVDPASDKDDPDLDVDLGDEGGDEDGGCFHCGKMSKKKMKKMKKSKKMWSDQDDQGEEEVSDDVEDEGSEDEGGEDEGGEDEGGEDVEAGPAPAPEELAFSKKKSKKKAAKKMKAEQTEEQQWWNSVRDMVTSPLNQRFSDGWTEYQEDALLPPTDPNAQVTSEPGPGDVGFAPQQKIGQ